MDVTISAGYSAKPYDLKLHVYTIESNTGGNYSRYHWDLYAYSRSGNQTYDYYGASWEVWIGGQYWSGTAGLAFGPSPNDYAGKTIGIASADTSGIGHDGNGYLNFNIRGRHGAASNVFNFGNADSGDQTQSADRIARPPVQLAAPTVTSAKSSSLSFSWSPSSDSRGASTDQYLLRLSPNSPSDAAGYSDYTTDPATLNYTVTGLTPGKTYYASVYAHNAAGYSAKSTDTTTKTTSGFSVWNGTEWRPTEVYSWSGTEWRPCEVYFWTGSAWKAAG